MSNGTALRDYSRRADQSGVLGSSVSFARPAFSVPHIPPAVCGMVENYNGPDSRVIFVAFLLMPTRPRY